MSWAPTKSDTGAKTWSRWMMCCTLRKSVSSRGCGLKKEALSIPKDEQGLCGWRTDSQGEGHKERELVPDYTGHGKPWWWLNCRDPSEKVAATARHGWRWAEMALWCHHSSCLFYHGTHRRPIPRLWNTPFFCRQAPARLLLRTADKYWFHICLASLSLKLPWEVSRKGVTFVTRGKSGAEAEGACPGDLRRRGRAWIFKSGPLTCKWL